MPKFLSAPFLTVLSVEGNLKRVLSLTNNQEIFVIVQCQVFIVCTLLKLFT